MSTQFDTSKPNWLQLVSAMAVLLALSLSVEAEETRSSTTTHIAEGGRENQAAGTESVDEYGDLVTEGERRKPVARAVAGKSGGTEAATQSAGFDFWFYEADVILFYDDDGDGYYYGIDLLFDVDTIYSVADVYAVAYLSYEGGPWNEYAVTEDFTIHDTSGSDEYVLVTELMSGYPTGSYDLLIELYDAVDGSFLAEFGPADSSELSFLPLEDFNRDAPTFDRPVAVSTGGGGSTGVLLLALLLAAYLLPLPGNIVYPARATGLRTSRGSRDWRHSSMR